jgi:hypothetical protein
MKDKIEIEQLAERYADGYSTEEAHASYIAFQDGYTQCQEDMVDKKYTEEDLHNLLRARRQLYSHTDENVLKVFINSLNKQD